MIGILNEKPSQARNFAAALGGASGTYNGEQYSIAVACGHLYEYVDPDMQVPVSVQAKYKSWDLANLPWDENDFAWKYAAKKDAAATLKTIKTSLSKCDEICIATDDDPTGEGQLLAAEILLELGLKPKKLTRMYFADESKKEIRKAFVGRVVIPNLLIDPDYKKALFRSRWDMLSMQWTRIATKCGDGMTVIREGRLKSAMKKIVGDQLTAIQKYVKKPFYQNRFKDENSIVYINPEEPQFEKKTDVPNTYHDSDVVVDSIERKTSAPPKLLDIAGIAARLAPLGISSKDCLSIYQKMYESNVVSYPRTEDKFITPEQFNDLLPLIDKIAAVVDVDTSLLTHRQPRPTHVKTGCAHGANRPGLSVPKSLAWLDTQFGTGASLIYSLLAKSYLSMLGEDYEYESQKGHVKDYPKFVGSTNIPKKLGYKAIFGDSDEDGSDDGTAAGLGRHANPFIHEGFPPKPVQPTMRWLFTQLEKNDVGTGATRASTYAEISDAKSSTAIFKDTKGKIALTDAGWMGYKLLPGTHIGDVRITEKVMSDMRRIAKGEADASDCLHEIQQMIRDDMEVMKNNSVTMRKEMNITMSDSNAPAKEKYEGTWNGKPVKFSREWGGHKFSDEECERLCSGEEIIVDGLVSKDGKKYAVTGKLAEQSYNGRKFVGFDRTGFANTGKAEIPDEWCKHVFTADEKELLKNGESVELEGCISKKGNIFSCKVHWGKNDKGYMAVIPEFE